MKATQSTAGAGVLPHPHAPAKQQRPAANPKQPDRPQPYGRQGAPVEPPDLVTLAAAAERLSLSDRTIRRAISAGELPGHKFGKAIRVSLAELDRWVASKVIPHARTVSKPARSPRRGAVR